MPSTVMSKVLQIIPELRVGGAERVITDLTLGLRRRGLDVTLATLFDSERSPLFRELQAEGATVKCFGKRPGIDLRVMPDMVRFIRLLRPDVLHTHLRALPYTLLPGVLARVPVMIHTVHNLAPRDASFPVSYLNKLAFQCGVLPVAVSRAVQNSMTKAYGKGVGPTILNGVAVEIYSYPKQSREEWRAANGYGDEIVFVSVGRLEPQKNHRLLLDAFRHVLQLCPSARLVIVGDGSLRAELGQQVVDLGLSTMVHFMGDRTDIPDVLNASDIFVLSSDWEGHPLSVIEAMAAGIPVIATDVGGTGEIVSDGVNGVLIRASDKDGLISAMSNLVDRPVRRLELGSAARQSIQKFGVEEMVSHYFNLYCKLFQRQKWDWPAET